MIADFFRFWCSTKPFQINIDIKTHLNKKTLWKVTWTWNKQTHEKRINFIRRHEICRVWDISLSHYPSQRLWVFWWQTVSYSKKNVLQPYKTVLCKLCEETVSTWKKHHVDFSTDLCAIHTTVHLSLTHSLTHSPVHNIPDAPTKRYFLSKKNISMKASFLFLSWQQ